MTLTTKEQGLLSDLKSQEQICIEKYKQYAGDACDAELKNLFTQIGQTEQKHLSIITDIQNGGNPNCSTTQTQASTSAPTSGCNCGCKGNDAYLCKDALSMEKHVSSLYDVSIFEFSDHNLRCVLNKIQTDEQHHGQQLYAYMSAHNIYG